MNFSSFPSSGQIKEASQIVLQAIIQEKTNKEEENYDHFVKRCAPSLQRGMTFIPELNWV